MVESLDAKKRRIVHSVFNTDISQPTPHSTPVQRNLVQGQAFGVLPPKSLQSSLDVFSVPPTTPTAPRRRSPRLQLPPQQADHLDDQVRFDRSWHVVTSAIALPPSVTVEDSFDSERNLHADPDFAEALADLLYFSTRVPQSSHTEDILQWHTQQVRRHFATHVLPLVAASATHVRGFEEKINGPSLTEHAQVLLSSVRTLEAADRMYQYGLSHIVRGIEDQEEARVATSRFRQELRAIINSSLLGSDPVAPSLVLAIRSVITRLVAVIFQIPGPSSALKAEERMALGLSPASKKVQGHHEVASARAELHHLIEVLRNVGLAGERFQVLFAVVMDAAMDEYVTKSFARKWDNDLVSISPLVESANKSRWASPKMRGSPGTSLTTGGTKTSRYIGELNYWIENSFAALAAEVTTRLRDSPSSSVRRTSIIPWTTIEKWKELAVGRLAALRIQELFDIVLEWPNSKGALDDLKHAVSASPSAVTASLAPPGTQQRRRLQLTDTFGNALQERLLHPGRSTLQILRVYVSMIRAFHALDQSKVLLDRVAQRMQTYLCQREDTVRIIVLGLLTNHEKAKYELERFRKLSEEPEYKAKKKLVDIGNGPDQLVELSIILADPSQQRRLPLEDEELDWEDLEWIPDPIDAGQNYRRPRSEDVIGTLINALGSQDVFIREFQAIVADRLLAMTNLEAYQETRVLRLLKKRFGEQALQATDVMLRDMAESFSLDFRISHALYRIFKSMHPPSGVNPSDEIPVHAKILSRLFWPNANRAVSFQTPSVVSDWLHHYEARYECEKVGRKLHWVHDLGTAVVELVLEDRTLELEVKTHQAALIHAFSSKEKLSNREEKVRKTAKQLVEELSMPEELVESALKFWIKKKVLFHNVALDDYWVIERLDDKETIDTVEDDAVSHLPSLGKEDGDKGRVATAAPAKEDPQKVIYWQFVFNMLKNSSSSMPLAQIAMMMKMLVADGFPWSNEQLQDFLSEKVREGQLEVSGGKYKLVKK